jgi:thiamine biosynthesis lipoprotein
VNGAVASGAPAGWLRRARPLLGTLVELGVPSDMCDPAAALVAGFGAIAALQQALSRFDDDSDLARFARLPVGASLALRPAGARALRAAQALHRASGGLFDISLGSAPSGWRCQGGRLHKSSERVQLDLGGIAKGLAVDDAVRALRGAGCLAGWVNAGGDLRAFGSATLPLQLRDELRGGVRAIGTLTDGAFATSWFAAGSRCRLHAPMARDESRAGPVRRHISVAAPRCLWADALTKIVALTGNADHPLLARLDARAWLH